LVTWRSYITSSRRTTSIYIAARIRVKCTQKIEKNNTVFLLIFEWAFFHPIRLKIINSAKFFFLTSNMIFSTRKVSLIMAISVC
jgi:hypothetical protein